MPPLLPPAEQLPFSVQRGDAGILITVHADAGQHPGLALRQASQWIQDVAVPVTVDLARIPLLNSRLVGWLFALIQEGPLTALAIRNANHRVQAQMRRIGLAAFAVPVPPPAAAPGLAAPPRGPQALAHGMKPTAP